MIDVLILFIPASDKTKSRIRDQGSAVRTATIRELVGILQYHTAYHDLFPAYNIRSNAIKTLDNIAEYYDEGTKQHICVGSSGYYLKEDTLVFTATMGGRTIATVEISLKDFSIIQCRAFANGVCEYAEQIAGIINANKNMIAERKRA